MRYTVYRIHPLTAWSIAKKGKDKNGCLFPNIKFIKTPLPKYMNKNINFQQLTGTTHARVRINCVHKLEKNRETVTSLICASSVCDRQT